MIPQILDAILAVSLVVVATGVIRVWDALSHPGRVDPPPDARPGFPT